jgi:perosamine synthetase
MTDRAAVRTIPLARPNLGSRERELIEEVLASDSLSMGPFTERFEQLLAHMVGRRHGIAVSSGTAGLHLVVRALGFGPDHEVITTPFSFVASANCLLYEGVTPRFVDIEEQTLGIDPDQVVAAASDRTMGIIAVDVFGMPSRLVELEAIAAERGWQLVEDSCEGLGSSLAGRPLGSFGEAAVFAFYPNKQITTGEGGMIVTDDDMLATTMRSARNQGRDEDGTWLRHVQLGYNYRLDELSAALGVAQLERYHELREGRRRVVREYERALGDVEWLRLPAALPGSEVDWFVYVVQLADGLDRDTMIHALAERGVPARPYFSPLHLQPLYRERFGYAPGDFPVTERVARRTMAIPFSSRHSTDEIEHVADALRAAGAEQGAR